VVQGQGGFAVVPRQFASPRSSEPPTSAPFLLWVGLSPDYYLFVVQNGARVTRGTLPGGRAFIRSTSANGGARSVEYQVDWASPALAGASCAAPTR
jgi:hypothetical protein